MRQLARTPSPPALAPLAARELAAARTHFEGTGNEDGFEFKAYRDIDVKRALAAISHGNCAYCEAYYDATEPGDVEHFRPKGGIETDTGLHKPGYWWLAACWENLLPSCIRCNRKESLELFDGSTLVMGKGNRFPLADETHRASGIGEEADEVPLLLDPCRENPADFIKFIDEDGDCIAVPLDPDPTSLSARRGRASIDLYGLNRAGLVLDRSRYLRRAKRSIAKIERAARSLDRAGDDRDEDRRDDEQTIIEELDALAELTDGKDAFSGMLNAVIRPALARLNMAL